MSESKETLCTFCGSTFFVQSVRTSPKFCPFCSRSLSDKASLAHTIPAGTGTSPTEISFVEGLAPKGEKIQFNLGPYQVLKTIGKGGMGEVHLAYDTHFGRRIAIKRVRTDLKNQERLYNRFLKEARITAQLTHPSIIPIYAIHQEEGLIYYTMPYVKGETLRAIFRRTKRQEKMGETLDHIGGSIPSLTRIFINIAQAIAYAHANGVIHRDVKPENIMIGPYGEVMLLDWGLAQPIKANDEILEIKENGKLTRLGKVVGTISYMAPERLMGTPANVQTDIYSLGVILYQILTLLLPFRRGNLKEARKHVRKEKWTDPAELAPYREVPPMLASICKKCLHPHPGRRYQTVDALIRDVENYIEGRSDWFESTKLDPKQKKDWEFQENVLLAEHMAITRTAEVSEWVSLMISARSFSYDIKLETKVNFGKNSHGIGFLLSVPEEAERRHLNDGYCLWLGTDAHRSTKLLRSTVEVLSAPEVFLERDLWHQVRIEKMGNTLHVWINDVLQFTYYSHLPLLGTHVGILSRDADYEINPIVISQGNLHVTVKCLAVPDAFLAHKDYGTALNEYRRIAYSFPGRAEGREALFRAGVTLLEQGRSLKENSYFELALDEFQSLHNTPGAPLEYLGKGLVYKEMDELGEEVKCYMYAFRRYKRHPMLSILKEQVIHRMHECSRFNRPATYSLIFLAVRHIHDMANSSHCKKLFESLQSHWEIPYFLQKVPKSEEDGYLPFAITLAFWMGRPHLIHEMALEALKSPKLKIYTLSNALYALLALGPSDPLTETLLAIHKTHFAAYHPLAQSVQSALLAAIDPEEAVANYLNSEPILLTGLFLAEYILDKGESDLALQVTKHLESIERSKADHLLIRSTTIWALLQKGDFGGAERMLHEFPPEVLSSEATPLHFLYGLSLLITEGVTIAEAHFNALYDVAYPKTWNLATYYITQKLSSRWDKMSFPYERRQLHRQLALYYKALGKNDQAKEHLMLATGQN